MAIEHPVAFKHFVENLYDRMHQQVTYALHAASHENFNLGVALFIDEYLKTILGEKECRSEVKNFQSLLHKHFQSLQLDAAQDYVEVGSGASSVGFTIKGMHKEIYIRFSAKNEEDQRPSIIAGVNAEESLYCKDDLLRIEVFPTLPRMAALKSNKVNNAAKEDLIEFNAQVIKLLGFEGLALNRPKINDFGFRVFEKDRVIDPIDLDDIIYDGDDFFLNDKPVLVVPFMFDTEDLRNDKNVPLAAQAERIEALMRANAASLRKSSVLNSDEKVAAIARCYAKTYRP